MSVLIDDKELLKLLSDESDAAKTYYESDIQKQQIDALKMYLGERTKSEKEATEGTSSAISKDVAQVVDYALPDLMEPFVSGGKVAEYIAESEEDEEYASDATALSNHVFYNDNKGFMVVHDAMKDGLIQKIGITKVSLEEKQRSRRFQHSGITLEQLAVLKQSGEEFDKVEEDEDGTYTVHIEKKETIKKVKLTPVPPEEYLIHKDARTITGSRYSAHRSRKTLSDLIEMKFDEKLVKGLPDGEEDRDTYDTSGRDFLEGGSYTDVSSDQSNKMVWLYEEYIRADLDGDGIAELVQAFRVGDTLLSKSTVYEVPFASFCPMPIPHKFYGESLADKVIEDQKNKTVLVRQLNDNIFLANKPRIEVPDAALKENGITLNDLLNPRVGGLIRVKNPGLIREIVHPDMTAGTMNALAYYDETKQQNSGITKNAQGMQADVIDKTATESRNMDRGQQTRKRLMARIAAETYMNDLFKLILHYLVHYQGPRQMKVRDEWQEMNPSNWSPYLGVKLNVGLGFNNREDKMMATRSIMEIQREALELGMVEPEHLYNSAEDFVDAAGHGDVRRYFADPQQMEQHPPKPDQAEAEMQQKMRLEAEKLKVEEQSKRERLQMESEIKREQIQVEMELKRQQMEAEMQLKIEQMEAELALKLREINIRPSVPTVNGSGSGVSAIRMGGKVG